jgi:hypothetical protein
MVESAKRESCLYLLQWKVRNSREVLCSSSQVTFIIDRWQPNLQRFYRVRGKCKFLGFRKFSPMEAEIHAKFTLFSM